MKSKETEVMKRKYFQKQLKFLMCVRKFGKVYSSW